MVLLIKKVIFPVFIFTSILILLINLLATKYTIPKTETYVLKAYKNTIALYKDTEIIKTYNNIVLNTLPKSDIQNFTDGIYVSSPAHAEIMLEDFDN